MNTDSELIRYFMQILDLEKEMESKSSFMLDDIPNGEIKSLISAWHDDEARHVQIAQKMLDLVIKSN
jgi:hypothetical protein